MIGVKNIKNTLLKKDTGVFAAVLFLAVASSVLVYAATNRTTLKLSISGSTGVSQGSTLKGGTIAFGVTQQPTPNPTPAPGYVPLAGYPNQNGKGSIFSTLGAPDNIIAWSKSTNLLWNKKLPTTTPKAGNSDQLVKDLADIAKNRKGGVSPGSFNPRGNAFNMIMVDSDREEFRKVEFDCEGTGYSKMFGYWDKAEFEKMINTAYPGKYGVPIPKELKIDNSYHGDWSLSIYDYKKDIYFTLWRTRSMNITGLQNLKACWAGYILNYSKDANTQVTVDQLKAKGFRDPNVQPGTVKTEAMGILPYPFGSNAAGLTDMGTNILLEEVRRGKIEHAIGLTVPHLRRDNPNGWMFSYPANRNDGDCPAKVGYVAVTSCPITGQRLRLPANFDLNTVKDPYARMVAEAVRDYGFILSDTAGCVCIRTESSHQLTLYGKPDFWDGSLGKDTYGAESYFAFPWEKLELMPVDWRH